MMLIIHTADVRCLPLKTFLWGTAEHAAALLLLKAFVCSALLRVKVEENSKRDLYGHD